MNKKLQTNLFKIHFWVINLMPASNYFIFVILQDNWNANWWLWSETFGFKSRLFGQKVTVSLCECAITAVISSMLKRYCKIPCAMNFFTTYGNRTVSMSIISVRQNEAMFYFCGWNQSCVLWQLIELCQKSWKADSYSQTHILLMFPGGDPFSFK